ncbi:MAG TPA: uroporphyrinogen-III C-methyltransferase [Dehalococcoidia bacterium]|nr:uroporphyrinogen-III C-methyltransferase [Dehalococcoidia bacterium]
MSEVGKVVLVGAGPGDPRLITVAGMKYLRLAHVVVYDRLISVELLKEASADAELVFAGKEGGGLRMEQEEINRLLVDRAREGKLVVRLKGGDPFVFGRGGEEVEVLVAAGIPYEVVPGVTSVVAAPAYAGIPLTHRRLSSSFAVVTAREDADQTHSTLDWSKFAGLDTLVILMGTRALSEIVGKLLTAGYKPQTPVAVIRWGTTPQQCTVTGALTDIVDAVEAAGLQPPSLTIVGEVVRLRDELAWFERRPLFGKRVLVTRSRSQARQLSRLLAQEGAQPVELSAIHIQRAYDPVAVQSAIDKLRAGAYSWAVFTSSNGVDIFFTLLRERALDARVFAATNVAAIGPATADALAKRGIISDLVPPEFVAEAILAELQPKIASGEQVLVPRAEGARPELIAGLRSLGCQVDEITLYRADLPGDINEEAKSLLLKGEIDIVTFTSSSTVRNLLSLLDGDIAALNKPLIACIGPITAQAASASGLRIDIMAKEYTIAGLVEAMREHFATNEPARSR